MKRFQQILCVVHLNEADDAILAAAQRIVRLASTTRIDFIHAFAPIDLPKAALEKYPWLGEPLEEQANARLNSYAEQFSGIEGLEVRTHLEKESNELFSILEFISNESFDLIVTDLDGPSRDLCIRLARKATCSVMGVPEKWNGEYSRVVVPTDFSKFSFGALDVGIAFSEANELSSVECLHVYDIGFASHRATLPKEELMRLTETYAQDKMAKFLEEVDSRGLEVNTHFQCNAYVATGVSKFLNANEGDILVMGTRGLDTVSSWLLGNNAENLLRLGKVPIIAVKEKGAGKGLLDTFLHNA